MVSGVSGLIGQIVKVIAEQVLRTGRGSASDRRAKMEITAGVEVVTQRSQGSAILNILAIVNMTATMVNLAMIMATNLVSWRDCSQCAGVYEYSSVEILINFCAASSIANFANLRTGRGMLIKEVLQIDLEYTYTGATMVTTASTMICIYIYFYDNNATLLLCKKSIKFFDLTQG